jgi:hypothetical protein
METKKMLKVADVRKRMDAHYRGEISYSKAVELLNEDAKKALNIANVTPRFPEKQLHLKHGARIFNIRGHKGFRDTGKPTILINCIEYWEADDPDFGEPEEHNAVFYPTVEEIEQIIEALHEAKAFLNEC